MMGPWSPPVSGWTGRKGPRRRDRVWGMRVGRGGRRGRGWRVTVSCGTSVQSFKVKCPRSPPVGWRGSGGWTGRKGPRRRDRVWGMRVRWSGGWGRGRCVTMPRRTGNKFCFFEVSSGDELSDEKLCFVTGNEIVIFTAARIISCVQGRCGEDTDAR